ncbi:glycerate kinase [Parapedobacter composti]|uniref:Glycerate kinase n=2 Tax=Parapedobacter composti TaxID=623281 RepID=A0A1I1HIQ5_9SPHI|nr:glycerate kinase [Parapedobacter composti]
MIMHVLIAPNAFKNALNAREVAEAIQTGLLASKLYCSCTCFPIGDGGDGTGELLVNRLGGEQVEAVVTDPSGRSVSAGFGWIADRRMAVIEMAAASGLHLLASDERNPLRASSVGAGQLIKAALDLNPRDLVIAMGGTATIDGGSGMLAALGVRFINDEGNEITDFPAGLRKLRTIDRSALDRRLLDCNVTVLCDVDNPLLGKNGAARVFGAQKGADLAMVAQLEALLHRFSVVIQAETGIAVADLASGGVAGGASAGWYGIVGATLVKGIDYFLDITRFDDVLRNADLVITGEGSIDEQTLHGKGPYGVARRAKRNGVPVIGLAGRIPVTVSAELNRYFDALLAINNGPDTLEEALAATSVNLERIAMQLGNLYAAKSDT